AFSTNDSLSGKTNLTLTANSRGNSIASLIHGLSGSAEIAIADGAIKGVNLGQMARNIKSAFRAEKTVEKTDFASLTATLKMTNGIISNDDLYMKAPFLRLKGNGTINLPAYTINYRLLPELVE